MRAEGRVIGGLSAFALAVILHAQASAKFDVVSIKPNMSGSGTNISAQGARFTALSTSVNNLLLNAYQLQDFQIAGLPDWTQKEKFDVIGSSDHELGVAEMREMLKSALADRFAFQAHMETREGPTFHLVFARPDKSLGPNIRRSDIDCSNPAAAAATSVTVPGTTRSMPPCRMFGGPAQLTASAMSLPNLIGNIQSIVRRPVIDATGLTGSFDLFLEWAPDGSADATKPSYTTALQEQLGLKLEPARGPIQMLVVDHIEHPTPD